MRLLRRLGPAAGVAWGAWASWQAEDHYQALGELAAPGPGPTRVWPSVSIVVPARNEAPIQPALPGLLTSLQRLEYPGPFETLVVDDASTDATGELARALGARVLRLEERDRPAGWLGKPHACWRGVAATTGEWLLFLDADTWLEPGAVQALVAHALDRRLDALSMFLRQRCGTFWERLLLPYAFQQFFAGVTPGRLASARSPEALLNGQCILIRRDVYERTGGHAAVRGSIVEDVALARALKAAGCTLETVRGEAFGGVRMYRSLAQVRAGFGKNAYAFLSDEPLRGARVALASTCAASALPLLAAGALARRTSLLWLGLVAWTALAAGALPWARRFGAAAGFALLQPVAALVFQAIALESAARSFAGRPMGWRGRRYTPEGRRTLPVRNLLGLVRAIVAGRQRSLREDSAAMVGQLRGAWQAEGLEHIPTDGPACLVINHWQRPGLWIGWGGSLIGFLVGQRRLRADPPVHWLVLSELRIPLLGAERHLAALSVILRRVAHAWQMVPLSLAPGAASQRAASLRHLRRLCTQGRVIGFFPEGHHGAAGPPGQALPGAGRFLAALARSGTAIVPVALWEQDGQLRVRFGPSPDLAPHAGAGEGADEALGRMVMAGITALLPPHLQPPGARAVSIAVPPAAVAAR